VSPCNTIYASDPPIELLNRLDRDEVLVRARDVLIAHHLAPHDVKEQRQDGALAEQCYQGVLRLPLIT
jgi:hypothetical protein